MYISEKKRGKAIQCFFYTSTLRLLLCRDSLCTSYVYFSCGDNKCSGGRRRMLCRVINVFKPWEERNMENGEGIMHTK